MSAMLRIVCRVIGRRVAAGEELDAVLRDYPKLTASEQEQIRMELGGGKSVDSRGRAVQ